MEETIISTQGLPIQVEVSYIHEFFRARYLRLITHYTMSYLTSNGVQLNRQSPFNDAAGLSPQQVQLVPLFYNLFDEAEGAAIGTPIHKRLTERAITDNVWFFNRFRLKRESNTSPITKRMLAANVSLTRSGGFGLDVEAVQRIVQEEDRLDIVSTPLDHRHFDPAQFDQLLRERFLHLNSLPIQIREL